ncbi:hypothetical protein N9Z40_03580 [Akkermansiaceae bacterium]|nr:hypothetical protein [Akkermansiaceae bacterium]
MNTTNILLATTSLLVVVAFLLSFGKFTESSGTSDAERERQQIETELARLEGERQALELSSYRNRAAYPLTPAAVPAPVAPAPTQGVSDESATQIKELQDQLNEATEEIAETELKNDVLEKETSYLHKEETRKAQRAERAENRVRIALLMGTVDSVNTEYGFATFKAQNSMTFQPGQELGIRRGSGILGRVRVSSVQGEQYSADILPNAYAGGSPAVTLGDELIRLPDDYKTPIEGP